jgi:hypothetical protein
MSARSRGNARLVAAAGVCGQVCVTPPAAGGHRQPLASMETQEFHFTLRCFGCALRARMRHLLHRSSPRTAAAPRRAAHSTGFWQQQRMQPCASAISSLRGPSRVASSSVCSVSNHDRVPQQQARRVLDQASTHAPWRARAFGSSELPPQWQRRTGSSLQHAAAARRRRLRLSHRHCVASLPAATSKPPPEAVSKQASEKSCSHQRSAAQHASTASTTLRGLCGRS